MTAVPRTVEVDGCPMCGGRDAHDLLVGWDRLHGVPGRYVYRRCGACRTVFQSPRVRDEDLGLLYPGDYYTKVGGDGEVAVPPRPAPGLRDRVRARVQRAVSDRAASDPLGRLLAGSRFLRERAFYDRAVDEMLPRRAEPGRALDIGCGSGSLVAGLTSLGWQAEGSEWDAETARVARENTGATIHVGGVEELDPALGPYDLVVMNHVFEHLPRPIDGLAAIRRLLSPGGRAVLVYPNPDSLGARRWGADHFHWDPPRHLVFPTVGAMEAHVGRAGLAIASIRTLARHVAAWSRYSRMQRAGETVRLDRPVEPTAGDRLLGVFERGLVRVGVHAGEEIVATLVRAEA